MSAIKSLLACASTACAVVGVTFPSVAGCALSDRYCNRLEVLIRGYDQQIKAQNELLEKLRWRVFNLESLVEKNEREILRKPLYVPRY
jgi:hypothetical protein